MPVWSCLDRIGVHQIIRTIAKDNKLYSHFLVLRKLLSFEPSCDTLPSGNLFIQLQFPLHQIIHGSPKLRSVCDSKCNDCRYFSLDVRPDWVVLSYVVYPESLDNSLYHLSLVCVALFTRRAALCRSFFIKREDTFKFTRVSGRIHFFIQCQHGIGIEFRNRA